LISFKLAEEESNWMAFLLKPEEPKKDTTEIKEKSKNKKKAPKDDPKTNTLWVTNPASGAKHEFKNVVDYTLSRNGKLIGFSTFERDSLPLSKLFVFDTKKEIAAEVFELEGLLKKLTADNDGNNLAFLSTSDTAKRKLYRLQSFSLKTQSIKMISDTSNSAFSNDFSPSQNARIYFSRNDEKLYFAIAEKPEKEMKDTLLPEEKVNIDLWHWNDPYLQPQQLARLKRNRNESYLSVFHFKTNTLIQLATEELEDVRPMLKGNSDIALGTDNRAYRKRSSWESPGYRDVYAVNVQNGEKTLLLEEIQSRFGLSPNGKYVYWYANEDSSWYAKPVNGGNTVYLSKGIEQPLYDESHDYPQDPRDYGIAGWTANDKNIIFYDKFDLWLADPSGKENPSNLTKGFGRKNNTKLRYLRLEPEEEWINTKDPMMLRVQNKTTKQAGFYNLNFKSGNVEKLVLTDNRYYTPIKARKAKRIIWRRGNLNEYYNLWSSSLSFNNETKLSEANPQQQEYNWGSVELVKWNNMDGNEVEGLLYKPENFDPNKKYPMIVYFYRLHSDNLFNHYYPTPSRSVINPLHYISNGYLVFMPNIHYKEGYPGMSAYNHVVSGTLSMIDKGFVDKENIGIQGQSWGGYQALYIVTQTNIFKAANSGAPVSNMTSAYGGIRWKSGMNRAFQYEETQSRIGGTLWEKPLHYIENSPVFYVPKINTPIMFRHDDADGAVPWYQGIEIFVAMRRLNKPAWLLNYNKAGHNLTVKRSNQMDFTIRMKQFFDHYLKGAPAPEWMVDGIPARDKGKNLGLELKK
jgi:dipeptidyl aminopeptidase/acylaminoacyl peptidase